MEMLHWFIDPIKDHYKNFDGRASRQQFWLYALWYFIFCLITFIISSELNFFFIILTLLPSVAIVVRRLHDVGRTGAWITPPAIAFCLWFLVYLFYFTFWVLLIAFGSDSSQILPKSSASVLIIFCLATPLLFFVSLKGNVGPNDYGLDPLQGGDGSTGAYPANIPVPPLPSPDVTSAVETQLPPTPEPEVQKDQNKV